MAVIRNLRRKLFSAACGASLLLAASAHAQERFITVASTTSTEQSGLFGFLLPVFEKESRHPGARRGARYRSGARPRAAWIGRLST